MSSRGTTDITVRRLAGSVALAILAVVPGETGGSPLALETRGMPQTIELAVTAPLAAVSVAAAPQVTLDIVAGPPGPRGPAGSDGPPSPTYTYDPATGDLVGIAYADGSAKTFTYDAGTLVASTYTRDGVTTASAYSYNPDGSLAQRVDTAV